MRSYFVVLPLCNGLGNLWLATLPQNGVFFIIISNHHLSGSTIYKAHRHHTRRCWEAREKYSQPEPGMFASCRISTDLPWQNKSHLDKFHYLRSRRGLWGLCIGSVRTKLKNYCYDWFDVFDIRLHVAWSYTSSLQQSFLFDIIPHSVQPSSLRPSSLPSPSPSFLCSVPLFSSHAHTTSTVFPGLSLLFPPTFVVPFILSHLPLDLHMFAMHINRKHLLSRLQPGVDECICKSPLPLQTGISN